MNNGDNTMNGNHGNDINSIYRNNVDLYSLKVVPL